ncbi:MAG TPA: hypothetical protein VGM44_24780 [Polyangiaceae bacterium]
MEKRTSSEHSPDSRTAARAPKDPKRRARTARTARRNAANGRSETLATQSDISSALDQNATALKPLLLGVGIGAALVGTAMLLRPKHEKGGLPFHGPNAELAGALTKSALLAVARVVSGDSVRSAATRALLDIAEAWKA